MPALAIYRSDTVTLDQYNAFRASLPLAAAPPEGLVHAFGQAADGSLVVVEIWDSRAALEAYNRDTVDPVLIENGLPPAAPEIIEVETLAITKGALPYVVDARPALAAEPA